MNVTVLIENTAKSGLKAEHGLSLLIEHNGHNYLLDAGSTDLFYENGLALGVDFESLDYAILSHGHYDHSGGFEKLFEVNPKIRIYAQESAFGTYLSASGGMHEISVPKAVRDQKERFLFLGGVHLLNREAMLIPHSTKHLERIGERAKLYQKDGEDTKADAFSHEQSLVLETEKGYVIFNSCSHGGVSNIIREVRELCKEKPIYGYVGGLHMKGKKDGCEICAYTDAEVEELCETFLKEGIEEVYTGHCTGEIGFQKIRERLQGKVKIERLTSGLVFEL